jgi:hypothetical protein
VRRDGYLGEDKDIVAVLEIGESDEVEETGPCFVPDYLVERLGEWDPHSVPFPAHSLCISYSIRCVICLEWFPASDFNSDQRRRFGNVSVSIPSH